MLKRIKNYFFAGLLITLPLFLTIYIILALFHFIDNTTGKYISNYLNNTFGIYIPGLGILIFIAIVTFAGFLSKIFIGKLFIRAFGRIIKRFPLINQIYPAIKMITEFMFSSKKEKFKKTVLVEYPKKGTWMIGFITNDGMDEADNKIGPDLIGIYIPFSPNPTSGFYALIPRAEVVNTDISIKDAMQLIISGGIINPKHHKKETPPEDEKLQ
ncbi:MAG: DUF502 domain-containing protein [Candidatus Omnitrophota bacterium]|jgi:uncharacterized membrane protein|nr:MAG: DUF502 domain-containing protein [Candidatus Omnitrophota bacterium]